MCQIFPPKPSLLLPAILLALLACSSDFEPNLKGWKATSRPYTRLTLSIDGRETMVQLPKGEGVRYRFPQWTKAKDRILLVQMTEVDSCVAYKIVAVDTTGVILDTIYVAPPNTALNYSLAPNDSLLLIKTYHDDCQKTSKFRYSFYNRYLKKALPDSIRVSDSRGIPLIESVWSPDSRKVILSSWGRSDAVGLVYDLVTKDTTYIDEGTNFLWSPADNYLVAYIKGYSVYKMDLNTGAKEILYEGKRKYSITAFRWNPTGDFMMFHVRRYLLNIVSPMTTSTVIIYLNMKDRTTSKTHLSDERVDTWK